MSRKVQGLISASLASEDDLPPLLRRKRRAGKGSKGCGMRFERALAKALATEGWRSGVWFKFTDAFGKGYAQTDLLHVTADAVYVIEAKLGNIEAGLEQFTRLYRPIVEHVFDRPAFGIVAVRYIGALPAERPRITASLGEAMERASSGAAVVFHWREGYPLGLAKAA